MSRGWAMNVVFGGKQMNFILYVSHNDNTRSVIWDAKLSPIKADDPPPATSFKKTVSNQFSKVLE